MLRSSNRRSEGLFEDAPPEEARGSGVGASKGLYADEIVEGRDDTTRSRPGTSDKPSVSQTAAPGTLSDADLSPPEASAAAAGAAGTGKTNDKSQSSAKDETSETVVYTSPPPFNVPLVVTASFVCSVFALFIGDTARVELTEYDEEQKKMVPASALKRYSIFGSFALVSVLVLSWGVTMSSRVVTKIAVIHPGQTATRRRGSFFSLRDTLKIYTPVNGIQMFKPRKVPITSIRLLGPLTQGIQAWHPRHVEKPSLVNRVFWKKTSWDAKPGAYARFVIGNDRLGYTINTKGKAWCADWEGLEKMLLQNRK